MSDLNGFDLDEIAGALSDQESYEHLLLVNSKTGELVFWSADTGIDGHTPVQLDDLDEDLIGIRPLPSWVWYQDLADFVAGVSDELAARRLGRAIDGKGAFRRFRMELEEEYPELLGAWRAFRDTRARRRAVEWLEENELIGQDQAARYLTSHPRPAPTGLKSAPCAMSSALAVIRGCCAGRSGAQVSFRRRHPAIRRPRPRWRLSSRRRPHQAALGCPCPGLSQADVSRWCARNLRNLPAYREQAWACPGKPMALDGVACCGH